MAEKDNLEVLVQYGSDMVTILEPNGTIRYESPAVERTLGYEPEELVGENILDYVHPEDTERAVAELGEIREEAEFRGPVEVRFCHKDGSWRYLEGIANNLIHDPAVGGVVINSRDITERKEAEEKLLESRDLLQAVMDGTTDAVYVKDTDGRYLMINPAGAEMLGKTVEEVIGEDDADLFIPEDGKRVMAVDREIMETGETKSYEEHKEAEDDVGRTYLTTRGPYYDQRGNLVGVFGVSRDISERKKAEDRLGDAEQRFRQLFEQSVDAIYVHDEEGRFVDCNSQACRLLGYSREELLSMTVKDVSCSVLTEGERARQEKEGGTLWQRTLAGEPGTFSHSHEEENIRKDGTTFPVEVRVGSVDYGGRRMMLVSVRDITERREAEKALRESERRLRTVAAGAPVIMFAINSEGVFTFESGAALDDLGLEAGASVGSSAFEVYTAFPKVLDNVRRTLSGENVVDTVEIGGRAYHATYSPQRDEDGNIYEVIGVATDVTERWKLEQDLEHLAAHDPLTGLANRRSFFAHLSRALIRTDQTEQHQERRNGSICLLFMDLDGFKEVNDRHGHEIGDALIVAVAGRIEGCLRPSDTAGRVGGDEFCILLEGAAGAEEAARVAGRLTTSLEAPFSMNTSSGSSTVEISASIGITVKHPDSGSWSPDELVREADTAMYRAKRRGGALYDLVELPETPARGS